MDQKSQNHQKKVLAISSSGGHWAQLLRLRPAFDEHKIIYVTTQKDSQNQVLGFDFFVVPDATRWNKIKLIILFFCILYIMVKQRPDIVISTGAAPGYFALMIGHVMGARTIWLESIANAEKYSLSTILVRPFADLFLTQWPHLSRHKGPIYKGSVL